MQHRACAVHIVTIATERIVDTCLLRDSADIMKYIYEKVITDKGFLMSELLLCL